MVWPGPTHGAWETSRSVGGPVAVAAAAGGGMGARMPAAPTAVPSTTPRALATAGKARPMALHATAGGNRLPGAGPADEVVLPPPLPSGGGDSRTRASARRRDRRTGGPLRPSRPPSLPGGRVGARRHRGGSHGQFAPSGRLA